MKKLTFLLFALLIGFSPKSFSQELKSEFLFDLDISLNAPQMVGQVLKGTRMIFPFKDGTVRGTKINGKIINSGADWGLVIDSTSFKMDVRATIMTTDSALIYISYTGYDHATAKNYAMISAGRGSELSPSDYYFRSAVSFETSSPKYAWLNRIIAVGVGRFPGPGRVAYRIYEIK